MPRGEGVAGWPRLVAAITLGVASLGSGLALTGLSAWLITRAWQMPPVLDLAVAVVAVRALGISRAVFGYCHRLAAHDVALRAAGDARLGLYRSLAAGPVERALGFSSGQLVSRLGADVDLLADVVVRAVIPRVVAAVLGVATVVVLAFISPIAAAVLAACLLAAGQIAPQLAARAVAAEEARAARQRDTRDESAMTALTHAAELQVSGRLPAVVADVAARQVQWGRAADRAARPAAVAAGLSIGAQGVAVLGAVIAGIALSATVAPTTVAVLMLLPTAAFEAVAALPAAAVAATRARLAGERLAALAGPVAPVKQRSLPGAAGPRLRADSLTCAHRASWPRIAPVTIELDRGALAVTGPSGIGKTTLLMTLAGLLPPAGGTLSVDGVPADMLSEAEMRSRVVFFAEDAHVFATTVRDNLLVARGDATDWDLTAALHRVGLADWLAGLPAGLGTVLVGGANAVSAGQRRRLLLARALVSPVPVVLLDEPTEHLDNGDGEELLRRLLDPAGGLFGADRTVVVATHQLPPDAGCPTVALGSVDPQIMTFGPRHGAGMLLA
jgi:ATP-binding cassette subfamily C protein CydC